MTWSSEIGHKQRYRLSMALVLVALFWLGNGVAWGKANPGGSKKSYPYHFFCTLYYLPKEEGFSASRGFDVRPVRAPGLGAHPYPASFLWAVRMEGAGRIRTPVRGFHYIRYAGGGSYEYCSAPTAANGHRLQAHRTCAISSRNPYLRLGQEIEIDSPTVRAVFGSSRWRIEDTGGGLNPWQIDLYWGEDEPRGSEGRDRNRPKGTDFEYAFDVIVTVLGQG